MVLFFFNENLLAIQIAIIALAIFLRCAIGFKYKIGQDTWVHLLVADIIRGKRELPEKIEYFIFEGSYGYPPVFQILLSFIPAKALERFAWIVSPIIEAGHIILIYFICIYITHSPEVAVLAMFLYAIQPELVIESSSLTSRSIGSLMYTVSIVSIILFVITGNAFFFLPCVVSGVILLYSHKHSTQALFFTLLGFTLLERNFVFISTAILIFGIAFLSPWYRKKILPEHWAILRFWKKRTDMAYQVGITHQINDREKNSLLNFSRSKTIHTLRFIGSNMWIFFIVSLIIIFNIPQTQPEVLFLEWALILFICAFLISYMVSLKFLGEGLRYLEYSAVPTVILAAFYFEQYHNNSLVTLAFIIIIVISLMEIFTGLFFWVRKYIRISPGDGVLKICTYLRSVPHANVMCLPLDMSFMIAYFTRKKVFFAFSSHAYEKAFPAIMGDPRTKPLRTLIDKYSIDYILADSAFYLPEELNLGIVEKIMEEEGYYLLQVKQRI